MRYGLSKHGVCLLVLASWVVSLNACSSPRDRDPGATAEEDDDDAGRLSVDNPVLFPIPDWALDGGYGDAGDAGDAGEPAVDTRPGETPPAAEPDANSQPQTPPAPDDLLAVTTRGRLVRISSSSAEITAAMEVTGLSDGERIVGGDVRPKDGRLYLLGDRGGLYAIDADTGVATSVAALRASPNDETAPFEALRGRKFGVDWNPVSDRLRVVSDAGENLRIDPSNGDTTTDAAIDSATLGAAAYTQSFDATCRTRLLVIDVATRSLLLQSPPNLGRLSPIAPLSGELEQISELDVQTLEDGSDRGLLAAVRGGKTLLLDLDLQSGETAAARELALEPDESLIVLSAPSRASAPAQSPGALTAMTADDRLITFNPSAPGKLCTEAPIGGAAAGERWVGMDVRPADGKLYALTNAGKLYELAVPSGEVSLVAPLQADPSDASQPFTGLAGTQFALSWNPVTDQLHVVSETGQNLRVAPGTLATTTDAALSGTNPSVLEAAHTNSFSGSRSTTLFVLGGSPLRLARLGGEPAAAGPCPPTPDAINPSCGVTRGIGDLGLPDGRVQGFDIDGETGEAWAAIGAGADAASLLYRIELDSGAARAPIDVANATIGAGQPLRALALTTDPTARAIGITDAGRVLTFELGSPSAPISDAMLNDLGAEERALGVDVRPADGQVYALGSGGSLYVLDPELASASMIAALSGDGASAMPVSGAGLDFNPVVDLLRVVGGTDKNLRVVPATRDVGPAGTTLLDATLNPGTPNVVGAAYDHNFAGSMATTLYVVDTTRDFLYVQGGAQGVPSPNLGELTPVGALGVDAQGEVGFDIAGGHDGVALAALRTSDSRSELYSIDLSTGLATPFNAGDNAIGPVGCPSLVGLTIELRR